MAKRRANREGNLRKRSDGRWERRYDTDTDKRIIKNVLGKTQTEAKAKLTVAQQACQVLDVTRTDEYTVTTWLKTGTSSTPSPISERLQQTATS